jgi:hypothetical protein
MKAKNLDLITAALNFAFHCLPMFQDHLRYQGHSETADHAKNLEKLRRKITKKCHKKMDKDSEKVKKPNDLEEYKRLVLSFVSRFDEYPAGDCNGMLPKTEIQIRDFLISKGHLRVIDNILMDCEKVKKND